MATYVWVGGSSGVWDNVNNWQDTGGNPVNDYPRFQADTARFTDSQSSYILTLSGRSRVGCGVIDFTHTNFNSVSLTIQFLWNLVDDGESANNTIIRGDTSYTDTVIFQQGMTSLDSSNAPSVASVLYCENESVVSITGGAGFENCYEVRVDGGATLDLSQITVTASPHTFTSTAWTVSGGSSLLIMGTNYAAMTLDVNGDGRLQLGNQNGLGASGNIINLGYGGGDYTFDAQGYIVPWGNYTWRLFNGNLNNFINYQAFPPVGRGVTWEIFATVLAYEFNNLAGYSMGSDNVIIKNGGVLDLGGVSTTISYNLSFESGGILRF